MGTLLLFSLKGVFCMKDYDLLENVFKKISGFYLYSCV